MAKTLFPDWWLQETLTHSLKLIRLGEERQPGAVAGVTDVMFGLINVLTQIGNFAHEFGPASPAVQGELHKTCALVLQGLASQLEVSPEALMGRLVDEWSQDEPPAAKVTMEYLTTDGFSPVSQLLHYFFEAKVRLGKPVDADADLNVPPTIALTEIQFNVLAAALAWLRANEVARSKAEAKVVQFEGGR